MLSCRATAEDKPEALANRWIVSTHEAEAWRLFDGTFDSAAVLRDSTWVEEEVEALEEEQEGPETIPLLAKMVLLESLSDLATVGFCL